MKLIKILAKNIVRNSHYLYFVDYLLEVEKKNAGKIKKEEPIIIEINDDVE